MRTQDKIRVLIADASSYARLVMSDILNTESQIEVVDTAQDGEAMLDKARIYNPDVIVVDIDILKDSRFYTLQRVSRQFSAALVLVGKEEKLNTANMLDAVRTTACQILTKPEGLLMPQMRNVADELVEKVKLAASSQTLVVNNNHAIAECEPEKPTNSIAKLRKRHKARMVGKAPSHLVVLGASTGGAPAIEYILHRLPADFSGAILVAQHMPPGFSSTFVRRLNTICALPVQEGLPGTRIEAGQVIVATGEANLMVKTVMGSKANLSVEYSYEEYSLYDRPSVDLLMQSAATIYEDKSVGIILSGLGKDGSIGLGFIHDKGGLTLAQDQDSSVIFGMAKSAIEEGVVNKVLPLSEIPRYLIHHIRQ